MKGAKVTLARFRISKAYSIIFRLTVGLLLVLLMILLGYHYGYLAHPELISTRIYFPISVAAGCAVIVRIILLEALFLFRMIFDKASAVWIQDGRIVYLSSLIFSEKCSEVALISPGRFSRLQSSRKRKTIKLTLNDGSERHVPCGALVKSDCDIAQALRAHLGI